MTSREGTARPEVLASRSAQERRSGEVSFEEFFRDEYLRLYRGLLLVVGSPAEAEDVAQEAMARVYERWHRVRGMESPVGYAVRIATNLNRRRLRRLLLQRRNERQETGRAPDAFESVVMSVDVREAVLRLPMRQRQVLVLVDYFDLSPSQAAAALGIRPGAARVNLHRARTALRRDLGGSYERD